MWRAFLGRYWPLLLLSAFGLFIFAPVLFFGFAFYGEEQIGFYYALSSYTQQALEHGTSLAWSSGNYGGEATNPDQFASVWNPINRILLQLLPLFLAVHVQMLIATVLGLLFCYWFGRAQGWHPASAVVLALGYLSATTYVWLQLGALPAVAFMLCPALLLALWYASRANNFTWYALSVLAGGLLLGFGLVGGFMQFILYNCCVAGLYALFLDWENYSPQRAWYRNLSVTLGYVTMVLIALGVGIKQWLPSAVLLGESVRTNTFAIQHASVPSPTEFIAFVLPPYFDLPIVGGGGAAGFYIGALGIVGAIVCLLYYRSATALLFAGAYAVVAALAFHMPGLSWLNEHISPFSHMSGNFRWLSAGAFPLAYLGAAGIEGILRAPDKLTRFAQRAVLWSSAAVAAVLVLGSLAISLLAARIEQSPYWIERLIAWYADGRTLAHPTEYYAGFLQRVLQDVSAMVSLSSPRFAFGILCWAASVAVLWLAFSRPWRHLAPYAAVACMVVMVGGIAALQWNVLVPQSVYEEKPQIVELVSGLEPDPHAYRVLGLVVGDGLYSNLFSHYRATPVEFAVAQRETLVHSTNLYWGIETMGGLRPYQTLRLNQLLSTVVSYDTAAYVFDKQSPALATSKIDKIYNRDVQKTATLEEKLKNLADMVPLLSMMNVKYVYSPYRLSSGALRPLETITIPIATGTPLYVYENSKALPRIYFASSQQFFSGTSTELLLALIATKDFSKVTWIECDSCTPASGQGGLAVDRYENGRVELMTDTKEDTWLVLSESYMPGWRATVDALPALLYRANYLFQAVRVPAGKHSVVFTYEDPSIGDLLRL